MPPILMEWTVPATALLAPPVLAGFVDVFRIVLGVLASLAGLGMVVLGLIALSDRAWRHGGLSTLFGTALLVLGFWLVGVIG